MKNIIKFSFGIFLLMPFVGAQVRAAEQIEIPFQLGQGQLLYEEYCSSCHDIDLTGSDRGAAVITSVLQAVASRRQGLLSSRLTGRQAASSGIGDMPPVEGMTQN
jgi:cytochrome c5